MAIFVSLFASIYYYVKRTKLVKVSLKKAFVKTAKAFSQY